MYHSLVQVVYWKKETKYFGISPLLPKFNMCWEEILRPAIIIAAVFGKRLPPVFPGCQWRDTAMTK